MKKIYLTNVLSSLESGSRPKGGAYQSGEGVFSLGAEHLNTYGGFDLEIVYKENLNKHRQKQLRGENHYSFIDDHS